LFPFDSCKIGICPGTDIWGTKLPIESGWDKLAWDSLGGILRNLELRDDDWESLEAGLKNFTRDTEPDVIPAYHQTPLLAAFKKTKAKNLLVFLQQIMNPTKRGFTLVSTSGPLPSVNRELWVGGDKIVMVDIGKYGTAKEDAFLELI
jgi:hypothetical protein